MNEFKLAERKQSREQRKRSMDIAQKLWEQAYRLGSISLDYTNALDGEEASTKVFYFLRNFRTHYKKHKMKNPALLEQMTCCKLRKPSPCIVQIDRKKISAKNIGTFALFETIKESNVLVPKAKSEKVLQKFKKSTKWIDIESNNL
jgi:hypothetical protein